MDLKRIAGLAVVLLAAGGTATPATETQSFRVDDIVIPEIALVRATVKDVLTIIHDEAKKADPLGMGIKFYVRVTPETLSQTLTLRLNKVTVRQAIEAVVGSTRIRAHYEWDKVTFREYRARTVSP